MVSLETVCKKLPKRKSNSTSSRLKVMDTTVVDKAEGVDQRVKRGRKLKSSAEESGIGKVCLVGGAIPDDLDIEACNRLVIGSKESEAGKLWNIGNELGLFEEGNRERILSQFETWEERDNVAGVCCWKG